MKTVDSDTESLSIQQPLNGPEEATDFLIDSKRGRNLLKCSPDLVNTFDTLKPPMGKGKFYQRVLLKNNVSHSSENAGEDNSGEIFLPKNGFLKANKTPVDKTVEHNTTVNKTPVNKTTVNKTAVNKTAVNKTVENKTVENKADVKKTVENKSAVSRICENKSKFFDTFSNSLENLKQKNKSNINLEGSDGCDTNSKLLPDHDTPPESPVCETWFKTWPERYEKVRTDSSPDNTLSNKSTYSYNSYSNNLFSKKSFSKESFSKDNVRISPKKCDKNINVGVNGNALKLTLNEALQNISLAYSPVTKQLHLLDSRSSRMDDGEKNFNTSKNVLDLKDANFNDDQSSGNSQYEYSSKDKSNDVGQNCDDEKLTLNELNSEVKKPGHRRTEAGSFSSTISSLSDPSPSGSLLETDEASSAMSEDFCIKPKKKGLSNFFTRNFSWRSSTVQPTSPNAPQSVSSSSSSASTPSTTSGVWKLFSKAAPPSPKNNVIGGSSALIQHMRPSTLPAKTEEEEQRHRDEYRAMLLAAKKKDAQTSAARQKQQKIQLQLEEQQATSAKHFSQNVLPNWESTYNTRKTKELWWQGLPSSVRGKVWRLAIGNDLNITQQLYEICLSRAQTRLNSPEPSQHELDFDQESSMDVIQLDIARTFPHLCIFQEGGPYSEVLHSLLAAYVCYRPDVGYVQGMSYIAAILILNMEHFDAFVCFANLLNRPLHVAAFTLNQNQMQAYYNAYNEVFSYNLPKLYAHFQNSGLTPDLYLLDWIYTIFAKAMPLDVACRVWDVFLRDGDEFIFRTALGILHLNQEFLLHMDFLHGAQFLTRLPDDISSDNLFKSIQTVTTNVGKQMFNQIVDRCSASMGDC